jgi:hypothetical protein
MILKELKLFHKWFEREKIPKIVRKPSKSGEFGGKRPNTVINIHQLTSITTMYMFPEYQWQRK